MSTFARFRWIKVTGDDYQYRRCPICNSRMVAIHYDNPIYLNRHNGVKWPADCNCGALFHSAKDDRGMWVIFDTQDLPKQAIYKKWQKMIDDLLKNQSQMTQAQVNKTLDEMRLQRDTEIAGMTS